MKKTTSALKKKRRKILHLVKPLSKIHKIYQILLWYSLVIGKIKVFILKDHMDREKL